MREAQGKAWKAFQRKWCVNLELEDKEELACRDWGCRRLGSLNLPRDEER